MNNFPSEYGPMVREIHRRAAKLRQPVHVAFELTSRCNLACRMCYVRHSAEDTDSCAAELSPSEWISLARQARDHGMIFLVLTGGEIFLRPDFFEIYEPLTRLGLIITLFSNGSLVTKTIAKYLSRIPPSYIEITLYGATAETYEAITGVQGSYARCCAGIEALRKQGIPVGLKTTITRQNIQEFDAMGKMAREWGIPFFGRWLLGPVNTI